MSRKSEINHIELQFNHLTVVNAEEWKRSILYKNEHNARIKHANYNICIYQ